MLELRQRQIQPRLLRNVRNDSDGRIQGGGGETRGCKGNALDKEMDPTPQIHAPRNPRRTRMSRMYGNQPRSPSPRNHRGTPKHRHRTPTSGSRNHPYPETSAAYNEKTSARMSATTKKTVKPNNKYTNIIYTLHIHIHIHIHSHMNATASARTFLFFVLLIVISQLCITYYVMNRTNNPNINIILSFILSLTIIIILTTFHEKIPAPAQFLLFTLFSYLFGLLFYQVKQSNQYSQELINEVILSTISVFISMAIVGFLLLSMGIRLGFKVWIVLFVGLLSIIISRIILILTKTTPDNINKKTTRHKLISAFGIFLFSGYVIYDTNIILQGTYYNKNEHIRAALSYYLDFANIFSNNLSLSDM